MAVAYAEELRPDQARIAVHPAKRKAIAMARRWGKTTLTSTISLNGMAHGRKVAWMAPTYRNTLPFWRWMENATGSARAAGVVRMSKAERIFTYPKKGGSVSIFTAQNADAARGDWFDIVIAEECALIKEDVITEVIEPLVADTDGDIYYISTPKGRNWFYRMFQRGRGDGVFVKSWNAPTSANPIPQIQQAYERAALYLPDSVYAQEWNAQFVEDATTIFSRTWWEGRNRYHPELYVPPDYILARWISLDTALKPGEENDFTAAVVVELTADYFLRVRHVWRDKLSFPNLVPTIAELALEWNYDGKLRKIIIEDKASGTPAIQTLRETYPRWIAQRVVDFEPSGSKRQRASQAGVWCRNNCVLFPHAGPYVPWLYAFEEELYDAPDAEYLDMTDAFSQAILYLEHYLAAGFNARLSSGEFATVA